MAVLATFANAAPFAKAIAAEPPDWYCTFARGFQTCGLYEQSKAPGRASMTGVNRDVPTALRLHTEPGDNNLFGSGSAERADVSMTQSTTGCYQGVQQWWAHSLYLPTDYVVPPSGPTWHWGVLLDFHHTGPTGQANVQLLSLPTGLAFAIAGGATVANGPSDPGYTLVPIGAAVKNTWYDFVYNVKWSYASDGFFQAWVNGTQKVNYRGPTLYAGQGCYLKLANYHSAVGKPVSVIHDRIVRGPTALSVANRPLAGVTTLVDGVLVSIR